MGKEDPKKTILVFLPLRSPSGTSGTGLDKRLWRHWRRFPTSSRPPPSVKTLPLYVSLEGNFYILLFLPPSTTPFGEEGIGDTREYLYVQPNTTSVRRTGELLSWDPSRGPRPSHRRVCVCERVCVVYGHTHVSGSIPHPLLESAVRVNLFEFCATPSKNKIESFFVREIFLSVNLFRRVTHRDAMSRVRSPDGRGWRGDPGPGYETVTRQC